MLSRTERSTEFFPPTVSATMAPTTSGISYPSTTTTTALSLLTKTMLIQICLLTRSVKNQTPMQLMDLAGWPTSIISTCWRFCSQLSLLSCWVPWACTQAKWGSKVSPHCQDRIFLWETWASARPFATQITWVLTNQKFLAAALVVLLNSTLQGWLAQDQEQKLPTTTHITSHSVAFQIQLSMQQWMNVQTTQLSSTKLVYSQTSIPNVLAMKIALWT